MAIRDKRGRFTTKRKAKVARQKREWDGRFSPSPAQVYRSLPSNGKTAEQMADPTYRRGIRQILRSTESYDVERNRRRELIAFFETVEGKTVGIRDLRAMGLVGEDD